MKFDPTTGEFVPEKKGRNRYCVDCGAAVGGREKYCQTCLTNQRTTPDGQNVGPQGTPAEKRVAGQGGCASRFMDLISVPMCLFGFPIIGVAILQSEAELWPSVVAIGLIAWSILMWYWFVLAGLKKIFKRKK